jgi:di/tricarboxylate transporter
MELSWEAWLTLGVVASVLALLVTTRLPADFVFIGGLGVLLVSGVLNAKEALSGFSAPGMITVGVLYVVVAGLQETGGLNWISYGLPGRPKSESRGLLRLMLPAADWSVEQSVDAIIEKLRAEGVIG